MKTRERVKRFLLVVWCAVILAALATIGSTATTAEDAGRPAATQAFTPSPLVAEMMAQVQQGIVYSYTGQLSGEWAALVGGEPYTITTRNTISGEPIQKATQFVYEHMQALSLTASYHEWTYWPYSNRNVIGVLTGATRPDEIVLIVAHLDDMPSSPPAPGADDNASGSVGVLVAADILSRYQFERTVRFVFFTGEEQGLRGSAQYAQAVQNAGDNIVAVYNMDMIAWNSDGNPVLWLNTRRPENAGYPADLTIAGVFTNVVSAYGLSSYLTPAIVPNGESRSDHASFWNRGYPAILAIEDGSDFNSNYHQPGDRLQTLDMTYFTNIVRASVGTAAHLARPVTEFGLLTGTISDADSSAPIVGAQVQAQSGSGPVYTKTSAAEGVYSLTLPAGIYSVTALADQYKPKTIPNIMVTSTITATLDISLVPLEKTYLPIVLD